MNDLAIVVCTSDERLSFVPVFNFFLRLNLHGIETAPVFLIGCTKSIEISGIKCCPATSSANAPWSRRMLEGLQHISEPNLLFLTEDILFLDNKNNKLFKNIYEQFIQHDLSVLRLDGFPTPDADSNTLMGPVSKYSIYRLGMQPSLWKRCYLIDIMRNNESIWEFEINGSRRSRYDNKVFSLKKRILPYEEVIARGKISRIGKSLLLKHGLGNVLTLPVRSKRDEVMILAKKQLLNIVSYFGARWKKYTGI